MTTKVKPAEARRLIGELAGIFPECFLIPERKRRPIKLGIHLDLQALMPEVDPKALSA